MKEQSTALSEEQAQVFLEVTGVATPPRPPETTFEEDEKNPDLAISHENPCEKSEALCEFMTEQKRKAVEILTGSVYVNKCTQAYSNAEFEFLSNSAVVLGMSVAEYVKYVSLNAIMHPIVPSPPKHLEK